MRLEDQVCSLELAKKLKELLVPQASLFYWCHHLKNDYHGEWWDVLSGYNAGKHGAFEVGNEEHFCAAFTVAELGSLLPMERICTNKNTKFAVWFDSAIPPTESIVTGETEADARAKMLIHLIEKGIVKP